MSTPHTNLLSDNNNKPQLTISQFLSMIPFGRFHIQLLFACGSGWLIDNMWLFNLKFILPVLQKEFQLSAFLASLLVVVEYVGASLGGLFWGVISDRIGRRLAFMLSLMLTGVFGAAVAFSPNVWVLYPTFFLLYFMAG